MQSTVAARVIPGAAVAIGTDTGVIEMRGYGRVEWSDTADAVSPDSTVYDLASLTKGVATITAVLLLAQDGRIRLDDPVQKVLPEFKGKRKDSVTWVELLTHMAGLRHPYRCADARRRSDSMEYSQLRSAPRRVRTCSTPI